jgi:hypothetical protein
MKSSTCSLVIDATFSFPNFGLMCSLILLLSLLTVPGFLPFSRCWYSSHRSETVGPLLRAIFSPAGSWPNALARTLRNFPSRLPAVFGIVIEAAIRVFQLSYRLNDLARRSKPQSNGRARTTCRLLDRLSQLAPLSIKLANRPPHLDGLGGREAMLDGVLVAQRRAAAGPIHAADAITPSRWSARVLTPAPIESQVLISGIRVLSA